MRYWKAPFAFDSPWYQMAPRIASGVTGAIIAPYSTVGLFGSSGVG